MKFYKKMVRHAKRGMPKSKTQYFTQFLLFLFFCAATWVALYSPERAHYFATLSSISYISLCCLVIFLIISGNGRLFKEKVIYTEALPVQQSFLRWQLHWWGAVFGMWFLWLLHCLAWIVNGPAWLATKIPRIEYLLVHYGQAASPLEFSYPWTVYMLATVAYVWYAGILKKPVPESFSEPLFFGTMDPIAKNMAGWIVSNVTQYCLILTLVSFVLMALKIIESFFPWPSHLEMGAWGLIFISLAVTGLRRIPWKRWGSRLARHQQGLLFWSLLSAVALMITLPMMAWLCVYVMPPPTPGVTVELVFRMKLDRWVDPAVRFETLVWGWWILWTPLMASYLALISRGQRFGAILCMSLLTPLVLSWAPFHYLFIGVLKRWQTLPTSGLLLLTGLLGIIVCWLLKDQLTTARLLQGWMGKPEIKVLRIKGLTNILPGWILLFWSVVLLHALGGWYVLEIQMVAPALILSVCLMVLNVTLLMSVSRRHSESVGRGYP